MTSRKLCSALFLLALAGTAVADEPAIRGHIGPPAWVPGGLETVQGTLVNQLVYEVTHPADAPATTTRGTGGAAGVLNDATFRSGLTYPLAVNAFDLGAIAFGPNPGTGVRFDWQCTFYNDFDANLGGCAFYSNVIGQIRLNNINPFWGFSFWGKTDFPGDGPGGFHRIFDGGGNPTTINFPDDTFAYEIRIFPAGTNNLWEGAPAASSVTQIVPMARGPGLPPTIGSSTGAYWRNDPLTQGTPAYQDICAANVVGSEAARRDIYLKLAADLPPAPPPTVDADLGTLDCGASGGGTLTALVTLLPGEFRWVKFTVGNTGINIPSQTYCDIFTNGDGLVDSTIALFDSNGTRLATDDDNGDLLYSQISFGHGRRPATGDATLLDGSNGDLAVGSYYLAVGGFGTAFGGSGFVVNPLQSLDAGDVFVQIVHNSGSPNCPLPPPIAPVATDFGVLPVGVSSATVDVDFHTVSWLTFTTDYAIDSSDPTKFLDINTAGTDPTVDPELGVYDALGNAVSANWNDDNSGDSFQAQLSFGDPGVSRPGFGDGDPASGQNGSTLPAATYYLAIGLSDSLSDVDFGPTGWQARSNSGSSVTVNVTFRTPAGCRADFNGDGNIDPDDLGDYINCYFSETTVAGSCPQADFSGDGNTDPDDLGDFINIYFSVTSGNPCV